MKKIISLCVLCAILGNVFAQKETFDLVTFTPPKVWKKQLAESAIQFSQEDAAKGTYCLITLYKAVPGTANSKELFHLLLKCSLQQSKMAGKLKLVMPRLKATVIKV